MKMQLTNAELDLTWLGTENYQKTDHIVKKQIVINIPIWKAQKDDSLDNCQRIYSRLALINQNNTHPVYPQDNKIMLVPANNKFI